MHKNVKIKYASFSHIKNKNITCDICKKNFKKLVDFKISEFLQIQICSHCLKVGVETLEGSCLNDKKVIKNKIENYLPMISWALIILCLCTFLGFIIYDGINYSKNDRRIEILKTIIKK